MKFTEIEIRTSFEEKGFAAIADQAIAFIANNPGCKFDKRAAQDFVNNVACMFDRQQVFALIAMFCCDADVDRFIARYDDTSCLENAHLVNVLGKGYLQKFINNEDTERYARCVVAAEVYQACLGSIAKPEMLTTYLLMKVDNAVRRVYNSAAKTAEYQAIAEKVSYETAANKDHASLKMLCITMGMTEAEADKKATDILKHSN